MKPSEQLTEEQRKRVMRIAWDLCYLSDLPSWQAERAILQALDEIGAEWAKDENELRSCLMELHAVVRGECPSLLNEDSGGDASLAIRIDAAIAQER